MGVILNITNFDYGDAYFNDQAITNGFEIKENGTLNLYCRGETITVNGVVYDGFLDGGGMYDGDIPMNRIDLDVSSLNEINVEYTYDSGSWGMHYSTYVIITITGVKNAIIELKPFLTNIANAIRTKKGTTAQINAQNFASEIESIESGGGSGESKGFKLERVFDTLAKTTTGSYIKFGTPPVSGGSYDVWASPYGDDDSLIFYKKLNSFTLSKTIYAYGYSGVPVIINGVTYALNHTWDNPLKIELDEYPYEIIMYAWYGGGSAGGGE